MQDLPANVPPGRLLALGVLAWLALSVAYRLHAGKPLFARRSRDAAFVERWASARFGRGLMARLNTSRNNLQVRVFADRLDIHPHFPFTVAFVPELYDLDKVIALRDVRSAVIQGGLRRQLVELVYTDANGHEAVLQLMLRKAPAFVQAVLGAPPRAS
jgi:hypothetical protein